MGRFLLYLFVLYIIFFLLKVVINLWRRKSGFRSGGFFKHNINKKQTNSVYDKSKAVDADFEEIK